jgi:hypothetical protein
MPPGLSNPGRRGEPDASTSLGRPIMWVQVHQGANSE